MLNEPVRASATRCREVALMRGPPAVPQPPVPGTWEGPRLDRAPPWPLPRESANAHRKTGLERHREKNPVMRILEVLKTGQEKPGPGPPPAAAPRQVPAAATSHTRNIHSPGPGPCQPLGSYHPPRPVGAWRPPGHALVTPRRMAYDASGTSPAAATRPAASPGPQYPLQGSLTVYVPTEIFKIYIVTPFVTCWGALVLPRPGGQATPPQDVLSLALLNRSLRIPGAHVTDISNSSSVNLQIFNCFSFCS